MTREDCSIQNPGPLKASLRDMSLFGCAENRMGEKSNKRMRAKNETRISSSTLLAQYPNTLNAQDY